MTTRQSLVGAGGIALLVANFWTGEARATVSGGLFAKDGNPAAAHRELKVIGGELLFVAVATLLAGISDAWGTAMVAVIVALFVLWAINHFSPPQGGTP